MGILEAALSDKSHGDKTKKATELRLAFSQIVAALWKNLTTFQNLLAPQVYLQRRLRVHSNNMTIWTALRPPIGMSTLPKQIRALTNPCHHSMEKRNNDQIFLEFASIILKR